MIMKKLTATDARNNWFELIRQSVTGHRVFHIMSKAGDAVLLSQEDYDNLIETLDLLSQPGLLKSVKKAKKEIKEGKTYSMDEVFDE